MENIAYLSFLTSIIGILFMCGSSILSGNIGGMFMVVKNPITLALMFLAIRSFLWLKQRKKEHRD